MEQHNKLLQESGTGQPTPAPKKPDDRGNIHIDGYVKISDPATGKVLVEVRE